MTLSKRKFKNYFIKSVIMTSLLGSALVLNACGASKKSTGKDGAEVAQAQPNLPAQPDVPAQPAPQPAQQPPAANATPPDQPSPAEVPTTNVGNNPQATGDLTVGEEQEKIPETIAYDPLDPSMITRKDLEKRVTGLKMEDGMVFTGASSDHLLTYLKTRMDLVADDSERDRNTLAARSIQHAKVFFDGEKKSVTVVIKKSIGHSEQTLVLSGVFGEKKIAELSAVEGRQDGVNQDLKAQFYCADLDGGCESSFLKLQEGRDSQVSTVSIVFRNSQSNLFVNFPQTPEESAEYMKLENFIRNSKWELPVTNRIKDIRFEAFEVINGKSGFMTSIIGFNKELIRLGGDLLAPQTGSDVQLAVGRDINPVEIELGLTDPSQYSFLIADSIVEAHLINNNGLGQVKFELIVRENAKFKSNQIFFTVMRKIKPIKDLKEDSLYQ